MRRNLRRPNNQSTDVVRRALDGKNMSQHSFVRNAARLAFLICCLSAIWQPADAYAQGEDDVEALKQKVGELILLARPDGGIAPDHQAYLKHDRDKLRRYVVEYVLTGGGK
jgi:hypothetical protein